jgi:excisionase family DNA binding protein
VEDQTRSLSEVAGLMGVSERTVRRWIKAGRLKAYKPGRDYRIPEAGLRVFIEESEISPKAQAPLPLEAMAEEQQRQWFLQQAPSEDERVMRLKRTTGIATGYASRWREERRRIEEEGTHPYGKSIEMSQLWEGFYESISVDGIYPYMIWVLAEDIEVSKLEREACINLDEALSDMLTEINEMRRVEAANKQRANDDAARGLEELREVLGTHSTGDELIK